MSTDLHSTNEILDFIAARHPWNERPATDYRISKLLKTSTSGVANWRNGRSSLSPEYAMRAAALLGWPEAYVLACVETERAERAASQARAAGRDPLEETGAMLKTWRAIADHFRPGAMVLLLALLGAFGSPREVRAESDMLTAPTVDFSTGAGGHSIHYAQFEPAESRRRKPRILRKKPPRNWPWIPPALLNVCYA